MHLNSKNVISRGELYNKYKKDDPKLAADFAGHKYISGDLAKHFGVSLIIIGGLTALLLISITAACNPALLSSGFGAMIYGMTGLVCGIGCILTVVGMCKKREALAEKLNDNKIQQIEDLNKGMLVD